MSDAEGAGNVPEQRLGAGDVTLRDADAATHRFRTARSMRWNARRVAAKWESRGWDLVAQRQGPFRTTMTLRRPKQTRRRLRIWLAMVGTVALVLVLGVIAAVRFAPSKVALIVDQIPGVAVDSDSDGIPDELEVAGWRTQAGAEYRTNPISQDSDGDGLSDGDEAGPPVESANRGTTYTGRSDPNLADTDSDGLSDAVETGDVSTEVPPGAAMYVVSDPLAGDSDDDGIGDGDEFFLDMDPLEPDTDDDGLTDVDELDFGSDPTLANPDDDSFTDKEEFERELHPLSYDLTGDEKLEASEAGLKYGDCDSCALEAGLRVEQIESVEYLAGHVASGIAVYGDFRDLALNLWKQKFLAAGVAALALIPYIGDGSKTVALLTKFARRGDRAEQAVRDVTDRLPLSESIKKQILDALPSRAGKLPVELSGGTHKLRGLQGRQLHRHHRRLPPPACATCQSGPFLHAGAHTGGNRLVTRRGPRDRAGMHRTRWTRVERRLAREPDQQHRPEAPVSSECRCCRARTAHEDWRSLPCERTTVSSPAATRPGPDRSVVLAGLTRARH